MNVQYSPRKPDRHTSLVVLGIEPPDKFPLVFYRDNCADIALEIDDVLAAPITDSRVFQFAGTNLSKEPSRSATLYAAELAQKAGTSVVLDLDFRPDQWHDPRAYGAAVRSVLHCVDIIMGTEDEINAAMLTDLHAVQLINSQVTDARVIGNIVEHVRALMERGPPGGGGEARQTRLPDSSVRQRDGGYTWVSGDGSEHPGCWRCIRRRVPLRVCEGMGALEGLPTGQRLRGYSGEPARFSIFMPFWEEVMAFVDERGGL